eukprot:gene25294-10948_t
MGGEKQTLAKLAELKAEFPDLDASGNPTERPLVEGPAITAPPPKVCAECGAEAPKMNTCASCHLVFYCNRQCQVSHWKRDHKAVCTKAPPAYPPQWPTESIDRRKGIALGTGVAPKVTPGKMTQALDTANPLEWDLNCWQHAKPAVFSKGRGVGCTQAECSVCTIQPLPMGTPCAIRILSISNQIGLGVCLKRAGRMDVYWKFSSGPGCPSAKFCSSAATPLPYGKPFKAGDVVSVCVRGGALEYDINGRPQGAAFTGFHPGMGDLFVRAYLVNSLSIQRTPLPKKPSRMSRQQLFYHTQNVGPPDNQLEDPGEELEW